jgi:hypothetical protein
MILKQELVNELAFHEEKIRLASESEVKRALLMEGIIVSIIAVVVVLCWPLLQHVYEVAAVNFVVYTDRKWLEATRCWEIKSKTAMLGVFLMFIFDLLSFWLSVSVILGWVMTSKYFFPTPSLPVRPGQFMGDQVANSQVGSYGINMGPMVIRWVMSFVYSRLEQWTARALATAQRTQRQADREWETPEEKIARRAARKEAKARKAEAAQRAPQSMPSSATPPGWIEPSQDTYTPPPSHSRAHEEFLQQLDENPMDTELDDLD